MPVVVGQAVREHLSMGLLTFGTVMETHLAALPAALQLQEPARKQMLVSSTSHNVTASLRRSTMSADQHLATKLNDSNEKKYQHALITLFTSPSLETTIKCNRGSCQCSNGEHLSANQIKTDLLVLAHAS